MMSDGTHYNDSTDDLDLLDAEADRGQFAHASRPSRNPSTAVPKLCDFAEWLPRLGPVLWLDRRASSGRARICTEARSGPRLLDHPALVTLCNSRKLVAHHVVSVHGPREWVSIHSTSGEVDARLYLLPDSDVLAWDEMIPVLCMDYAGSEPSEAPTHTNFLRRALGRFGPRWQARLLEFRNSHRPCLNVLDAQPPLKISLLGIELAGRIVRDQNADWISPLHR